MTYHLTSLQEPILAWMTIDAVADKSGKSRRTIERAISDHFLLSRKLGRDRQVWYSVDNELPTEDDGQDDTDQIHFLRSQLEAKDQQIVEMQKALDQAQQLQALSETRLQGTEQKLIQEQGKTVWQRLMGR